MSKICWVQFHIEFSSDKFFRGRCTQIVLSWKISGNFHWIFFWFFSIVFKSSDLPIYKKLEVNGLFRQIFTKKLKNIPINNLWHWPDATLLRKKFKFFWYGQPQNYYHPSVIERSWLDFISVVKKIVLNHALDILMVPGTALNNHLFDARFFGCTPGIAWPMKIDYKSLAQHLE